MLAQITAARHGRAGYDRIQRSRRHPGDVAKSRPVGLPVRNRRVTSASAFQNGMAASINSCWQLRSAIGSLAIFMNDYDVIKPKGPVRAKRF